MKSFHRGDIVNVSLNPVKGKEQQGEHCPCLVLSPEKFNQLGTTLVAPVSQGGNHARYQGFAVTLMGSGTKTQGVVLVNAIRILDLNARKATYIEKVPDVIIEDALARLATIID